MSSINQHKYKQFKKAYQKAMKEGKETFEFEGQVILVAYAKYVCEYMESISRK